MVRFPDCRHALMAVLLLVELLHATADDPGWTPLTHECCKDSAGNPYGTFEGSLCTGTDNQDVVIQYSANGVTWYNQKFQCGALNAQTPTFVSSGTIVCPIALDYNNLGSCSGGLAIIKLTSSTLATVDYTSSSGSTCNSNVFTIDCEHCPADETSIFGGGCFSERSSVTVKGKGLLPMKDLKVGDWVLVDEAPGSNIRGIEPKYEVVYAFGHRNADKSHSFVQIHTEGAKFPLEITPDHLVYVDGHKNPVRGDSIKVGDKLRRLANIAGVETVSTGNVTKVAIVQRKGLYAPLVAGGVLVVNDIVASSYISLQDSSKDAEWLDFPSPLKRIVAAPSHQDYVHMTLAPLRLLCMGVFPSSICDHRLFYNSDGIPHYIAFGIQLHHWLGGGGGAELLLFVLVWVFTGAFRLLEMVAGGAAKASLVVFLLVSYIMKDRHCRKRDKDLK